MKKWNKNDKMTKVNQALKEEKKKERQCVGRALQHDA